MCFPYFFLLVSMVTYVAQSALPAPPILIPVQIINGTAGGTCPSQLELSEAGQQLKTIVLSALDDYRHYSNLVSSCSDLSLNSTTGYYWISAADAAAVETFCDFTETNPITSCSDLPARSPAGYYWTLTSSDSPTVQRFCNVGPRTRPGGCGETNAWTRVGFLNMSDPSESCPDSWVTMTSPRRTCGRGKDSPYGCSSKSFPTSVNYSLVCGRIVAYHVGGADGFDLPVTDIDMPYLDGISLTHMSGSEPRQHIWSFIAAAGEVGRFHSTWLCDCSNGNDWQHSLLINASNYFCDTGNHKMTRNTDLLNYDDPLWDGQGCGPDSTCCQFNNPPWFHVSLPQPTTDDLEVRTCQAVYSGYDTSVELIEIYVQ